MLTKEYKLPYGRKKMELLNNERREAIHNDRRARGENEILLQTLQKTP